MNTAVQVPQKEPSEKLTFWLPKKLRQDLRLLGAEDKRSSEADYLRKVLSDHVDQVKSDKNQE